MGFGLLLAFLGIYSTLFLESASLTESMLSRKTCTVIIKFASLSCPLFTLPSGMPLNKSLYTISYQMVTSAAAGITLCLLYTLVGHQTHISACTSPFAAIKQTSQLQVDVYNWRRAAFMLEWMGKHSLGIFILITSNIIVIAAQGFYLKSPENNIVSTHSAVTNRHQCQLLQYVVSNESWTGKLDHYKGCAWVVRSGP